MSETFAIYEPGSHSYQEYDIVFGEAPKQGEPTYSKMIHIGKSFPKYVVTPEGKNLELPKDLPELSGGLKEIIFQIEGVTIIRIFARDFVSQIPVAQNRTAEAVANSISQL